ncbi:hypothetical protein CYMTET_43304 [Cymbomonas tetramitiformis]|uniref:Uncharacterized protein n=1 Tax=Cymbomonas tetramitiformis TaxID=36881 RepID=A0AAE0C434_9CHLO|nr:hypothetical protein CYMTET_43304 [Cymbomonas tetramitiformis]
MKHSFAAKPLAKGGNWSQRYGRDTTRKHFGAHSVSFHVLSKACIPECARCAPGHWHDTANCPTSDMECTPCEIEEAADADGMVSAFQTAFNAEDDASFARLCAVHEHPLVRQDEDPFTFDEDIDVGLRAQYAGLVAPQPSRLATRMQEAQHALQQLKQVAGGAREAPQHFPMVHFGSRVGIDIR